MQTLLEFKMVNLSCHEMGRDHVLFGAHEKHEGEPPQVLYARVSAWDAALGATRYRSASGRL
jgi:hypothetical protein